VLPTGAAASGQPGWIVLGALFVLATAPALPATRWALRTRTLTSAA
jgi:hypothetical protein